jgi:hypothetical protein
LLLFTAGYLDRIALAAAGVLSLLPSMNPWSSLLRGTLLFALVTPLLQIVALFAEQEMEPQIWYRLPIVPAFFVFDIFAALQGMIGSLSRRAVNWTKTERSVNSCRQHVK